MDGLSRNPQSLFDDDELLGKNDNWDLQRVTGEAAPPSSFPQQQQRGAAQQQQQQQPPASLAASPFPHAAFPQPATLGAAFAGGFPGFTGGYGQQRQLNMSALPQAQLVSRAGGAFRCALAGRWRPGLLQPACVVAGSAVAAPVMPMSQDLTPPPLQGLHSDGRGWSRH
jgi:hypothetical protein